MARTMRRNKRAFRTASGPESPEPLPRRSGLLELQGCLNRLARLQGMFEFEEHHMDTRWFECDRFARIDFKSALHRAHFHHAIFHGHGVNLAFGARISRNAGEPVRCPAVVGDRQVASR